MKIAWETLAAAILVAACILFIGRYQISSIGYGWENGGAEKIYRLDRWTGKIDECTESQTKDGPNRIACAADDPSVQKPK
jgi:hypothetical protein